MDFQQALDFEGAEREAALRRTLAPLRLPDRSVELILAMARVGRPREVAGHQCLEWSVSKRNAAKTMKCSPNTFVAAAADLQRRGCLEIVAFGQCRTYFLSVSRVTELAPIEDDPIDELGLFAEAPPGDQSANWSALVSAGQGARVPVNKKYISPDRERVPVPCTRGGVDQSGRRRLCDLPDDTVRRLNLAELRPYYDDAIGQGWISSNESDQIEEKRKFLAICHHAASCAGIHYPGRIVYCAVRDGNYTRINQASWDWAKKVLQPQEPRLCEA